MEAVLRTLKIIFRCYHETARPAYFSFYLKHFKIIQLLKSRDWELLSRSRIPTQCVSNRLNITEAAQCADSRSTRQPPPHSRRTPTSPPPKDSKYACEHGNEHGALAVGDRLSPGPPIRRHRHDGPRPHGAVSQQQDLLSHLGR
eukprot:scaffold55745_cov66-Phaeocystis_antarctica.AAC.4